MRKQKNIVPLEDYQNQEAVWPEDYSDLYEAVSQLPKEIRVCVALYYLEGYSIKETAKILDVTESAVKNRLLRAREKLRSELEQALSPGV